MRCLILALAIANMLLSLASCLASVSLPAPEGAPANAMRIGQTIAIGFLAANAAALWSFSRTL